MGELRYCSNCGAQVSPTANFCARCGKPVSRQAAQPAPSSAPAPARQADQASAAPRSSFQPAQRAAPAAATPQEQVAGVIPGAVRHSGVMGLKMETFVIVLTDRRILFAAQTNQMMQENIKQARDNAKQDGKGFFGQWGAQFGANSGQHYLDFTPQQILGEQPGNFYINADQLRSIRLHEYDDGEGSRTTYHIEFATSGGKFKFELGTMNKRQLKKQLEQLYGSIVR